MKQPWDDPHQQALRYAADLATLYEEVEHVRGNLYALRQRLFKVARAGLQLVECLSTEQVTDRLLSLVGELFQAERAAVYLGQAKLRRLSASPPGAFVGAAPLTGSRAARLEAGSEVSGEWLAVGQRDSVWVVPIVGRRRRLGLIACAGAAPAELGAAELRALLELLGSFAGVTLENLGLGGPRSGGPEPGETDAQGLAALLGEHPRTAELLRGLTRLQRLDATVLLEGETGTGKSLLARGLHAAGPRATKPCVVVNCSAIPEHLVESELFGHEAGAFTGAQRLHRGKVELAEGGTLFLDEVAELPLHSQAKLLTFLESKRFTRVGGERELDSDVRVVAATNRDLERCVAEGSFRADLYYRLNVFGLEVPPLRERGDEVLRLAQRFVREVATRYELPVPPLCAEAERVLRAYPWPGNVRELRNVIEKAVVFSEPGVLDPSLLPGEVPPPEGAPEEKPAAEDAPSAAVLGADSFSDAKAKVVERWERAYFSVLLQASDGNVTRAAELAKMDKKYLRSKLKRLEIDAEDFRPG